MSMLLQHRVKKLLSSSSELAQAKSLLDSLPDLLPNDAGSISSAELRVSLKASLDASSLDAADAVLRATERLMSSMDVLKKQGELMDRKCRHVMAFLDTAERTSTQFVAQAAALRAEQDAIQLELDSTKDFLKKYQVSLDDLKLVEEAVPLAESHGTDTAMATYFQLLHRLQAIRSNCERLVEDNPAPSSLEYLEDICRAQAMAFEKLYAWTSVHCNADTADATDDGLFAVDAATHNASAPGSTRLLPQAVRFLRGHPAFYTYCVDALTQTRRNGLLRRFVQALTVGGAGGIPRPIEIHAHDPVRYAGEMLAWVHQTVVGETDFFKRIIDEDHFQDVLGNACAGLAKPLQVRLHQITHGPTTTILQIYSVVHVVAYYHAIVSTMLPPASDLASCLSEAHNVAETQFATLWQAQLDQYQAALKDSLNFSLSVAHPTLELAHKVGHLIDSYVNALLPHGIEAAELAKVLDPVVLAVLHPLASGGALPPSEMNVFVLNQLACIHATLGRFDVARPWQDRVHAAMASAVGDVAKAQADGLAQRSGVAVLLAGMQQHNTSGVASVQSDLEPDAVRRAVHQYCTQLMALHLPVLDRIGAPEWRNLAETSTAEALSATYDAIHAHVSASPLYPPGTLVHTPQEIRTILDI